MGMSIDEAIQKYKKLYEEAENNAISYAHLEEFKKSIKHSTEAKYCELSKEECIASAIEYKQLIEWLEKYQKIEQILDNYVLEAWEVLEKIKKVVEDGNDK